MHNANIPTDQEVPSTAKLIKSTILAAITAGILLVSVVMPAEYGIDPTGLGKVIGLKKMGEIKVSLAEEAAAGKVKDLLVQAQPVVEQTEPVVAIEIAATKSEPAEPEPAQSETPLLSHEMKVILAPNEGTEIKVAMSKGNRVQYTWWTDGGKANFDVHGDSKKLNINYHNYSKGSARKREGTIEAAFDGSHGWFWRNRTVTNITIVLQTNGEYTNIKHLK